MSKENQEEEKRNVSQYIQLNKIYFKKNVFFLYVPVSFPALIISGSTVSAVGYGPMPNKPFSLCNSIEIPSGKKLEANVGILIIYNMKKNKNQKKLEETQKSKINNKSNN